MQENGGEKTTAPNVFLSNPYNRCNCSFYVETSTDKWNKEIQFNVPEFIRKLNIVSMNLSVSKMLPVVSPTWRVIFKPFEPSTVLSSSFKKNSSPTKGKHPVVIKSGDHIPNVTQQNHSHYFTL